MSSLGNISGFNTVYTPLSLHITILHYTLPSLIFRLFPTVVVLEGGTGCGIGVETISCLVAALSSDLMSDDLVGRCGCVLLSGLAVVVGGTRLDPDGVVIVGDTGSWVELLEILVPETLFMTPLELPVNTQ